jgi:dTMP kinase
VPDLTFILDVPVEVGMARIKGRGGERDRFESEDLEFHIQLREAFRDAAEREPKRCVLIDASQNADLVAVRIWMSVVERLLKGRAPSAAPRATG